MSELIRLKVQSDRKNKKVHLILSERTNQVSLDVAGLEDLIRILTDELGEIKGRFILPMGGLGI